jgi:hypothetical protein
MGFKKIAWDLKKLHGIKKKCMAFKSCMALEN